MNSLWLHGQVLGREIAVNLYISQQMWQVLSRVTYFIKIYIFKRSWYYHNIDMIHTCISFRFITTIFKWGTGFCKDPSRATRISTIAKWDYGSGRTKFGQLVSQLSPRENVVQGEPWGLLEVFSTFRSLSVSWRRLEHTQSSDED